MRTIRAVWIFAALFACLLSATSMAAGEEKAEYYNPGSMAIARGNKAPTIWEAAPKREYWGNAPVSAQQFEEMRSLLERALQSRFADRENEFTVSTANGGLGIKAPPDIRAVAAAFTSVLTASRRKEVSIQLDHLALSRQAAERLDGTNGAILDAESLKWLREEEGKAESPDVAVRGRLGTAGIASDAIICDAVAPLPTAYFKHDGKGAAEVAYSTIQCGGWFQGHIEPAGPGTWSIALRALLAWDTESTAVESEAVVSAGQTALPRKVHLQLPSWRSLAFNGSLRVRGGETILLALTGCSDDAKPGVAGKPFEALLLRVDDTWSSTEKGPVAICFDGSSLDPASVLIKMRELNTQDAKGAKVPPLKAWNGSSMILLDDVSLRPLARRALTAILPSNEPQRLRVLFGAASPDRDPRAVALSDTERVRDSKAAWESQSPVWVSCLAATSGSAATQLDLQAGQINKTEIGLAQPAISSGVTLSAACSGAGKRRRLVASGAFGLPSAGAADSPQIAVHSDTQLEVDAGYLLPASGQKQKAVFVLSQSGPIVDVESPAGSVSEFQPAIR
jgi:hypothetical protein